MKKRMLYIIIFILILFLSNLIYQRPKLMVNKSFDAYFYNGIINGNEIESTSEANIKYNDQINVQITIYKKRKLIGDDIYKVDVKIGDDLYSTNGFITRFTYKYAPNVSDYNGLKNRKAHLEYPDFSLQLCITNDFSKFSLNLCFGGNRFDFAGPATIKESANDIASNIYNSTK